MFEKQVRVERFDLIQTFHACKQEEGKLVAAYVLQMKGYEDQLECLGYKSNKKSLKAKGKGKTNGKGKGKQVYIPKPKNLKPAAKEHPAKDDTCHRCKEVGRSKSNFPTYLVELIKKKKQVGTASSSDIFVIELFSFPSKSWVYDTSCGTFFLTHNMVLEEGRAIDLEEIQDEDTSPSEITSKIPMEVEGFEPPQKEVISIYRCYKCGKQSMMDNMVCVLVDLPPGCKTVRSNRIFKKKNDMDEEATFILGIKIYRDRSKRLIGLGQNAYMENILKRYKMNNSKPGHIPMQEKLDLNKTQGASTPKEVKRMQNAPYASAVGSTVYAVKCTRPDVAFA
nr:retrotransposon protein, putative, Ty1-copia subclass [Tanacetum cinerariifolium]